MSLIKNKKRVKERGEVFTPPELVNEMLDRLPPEMWEDNKTFLDPAAGNGNMLLEVYRRKMRYEHDPYKIASTTYGIDIMEDNVAECKQRLSELLGKYIDMFAPECITAAIIKKDCNKIIDENIKCANSLEVDWCELFNV
jgi:hypothetical protein